MVDFSKARRGFSSGESSGKSGGEYKPFCPQIQWRENNEQKYILIITPQDDCISADLHEFIPVGTATKFNGDEYERKEHFVSRKDPIIGEDTDHLIDKFDAVPRRRTLGTAVELEPVVEVVQGRNRAKGFTVQTKTFTRNNEEVTVPMIGVISQSEFNFWGWLGSFDNTTAPVTEVPMQVTRNGTGTDTTYNIVPHMGTPVDLSDLFKYIDNVAYLKDLEVPKEGDDFERAAAIGKAMTMARVQELGDDKRWEELVLPLTDYKPKFPRKSESKPKSNGQPASPSQPVMSKDKMDKFAELRKSVEKA